MATQDLLATQHRFSSFLSDHAEESEQPDIGKTSDRAFISSRILKTSILGVTAAAAIAFAILSVGNPPVLFANAMAFLTATSAFQAGTGESSPIIQSTAGAPALPPTASPAPTGDETAATFTTAGQEQAEIRQPPAEALLSQFQAWAADEDARAEVRPVPPVQAEVRSVQPEQDARPQIRPVQKHRQVRRVQNARTEIRAEQNLRARVGQKQNARVQVRPAQDAQAQERSAAQAPSFLQSIGLRE
jgi:hypothetical protein